MKLPNTLRSFRSVSVAISITSALVGGASLAGQITHAPSKAQGAPLTLLLNGPADNPSTLIYTAEAGWRLHAGWDAGAQRGQDANGQSLKTALKPPQIPTDEQPLLGRPLTVFIDGPTGFTFIYAFEEGWKFVGQVANERR